MNCEKCIYSKKSKLKKFVLCQLFGNKIKQNSDTCEHCDPGGDEK
jgi:hypothetical protein